MNYSYTYYKSYILKNKYLILRKSVSFYEAMCDE